jgi:hypothetical protein
VGRDDRLRIAGHLGHARLCVGVGHLRRRMTGRTVGPPGPRRPSPRTVESHEIAGAALHGIVDRTRARLLDDAMSRRF